MAEVIIARHQFRRGTAAEWIEANPVLADGEPGVERDTGKQKIGDGVRTWTALPYTATKGDPGPAGVADDASVKTLVEAPGSATRAALNATYGPSATQMKDAFARVRAPRVAAKLATKQNIKVTFIGDSGLEGSTAGTPGTDDAASLFCTDLATRFGVTVTKSNRAVSGHCAYWHLLPLVSNPTRFTNAITDNSDLYVISFGHNDIRSDLATPGTGYPLAASMGALEHMVRRIRTQVPGADIIVSNEWQYTGTANGSNTPLTAHGNAMRRLAAHYSAEFVDYAAALAAKGVTGTTPATDDLYIHPTGTNGGQHPNSAGHRVWADALLGVLPAGAPVTGGVTSTALPGGLYNPDRYGAWANIPASSLRTYGTDGYRLVGSWAGTNTLPVTTSTAGDYVDVQFVGTEAVLQIDTGTGQGTVKVTIDAVDVYASLNLATHGAGQTLIPLTGLAPGFHRVVVTVLSGSMTLRSLSFLTVPAEKLKWDSTRITYAGTWTSPGANAECYYGSAYQTGTLNDSLTIEFIGTGLAINGYRYTTGLSLGLVVDGVTKTDLTMQGASANGLSHLTVVSGLPYGRHTVTLSLKSSARVLALSGYLVLDETRVNRPGSVRGIGKVGEAVTITLPLPSTPSVTVSPAGAGSTVPPYASAPSVNGFTLAGTATALTEWTATTDRNAW